MSSKTPAFLSIFCAMVLLPLSTLAQEEAKERATDPSAQEAIEEAKETTNEAIEAAKQAVLEAIERAKEAATSALESEKDVAKRALDKANEATKTLDQASEATRGEWRRPNRPLRKFWRKQKKPHSHPQKSLSKRLRRQTNR